MRTIIAGSRGITDYAVVEEAVRASGFKPTVILSGTARGVDRLGERWAREHDVLCQCHPAPWKEMGPRAGFFRNEIMAGMADALIAVWDGGSRGTKHMIETALAKGLTVYIHDAPDHPREEGREDGE